MEQKLREIASKIGKIGGDIDVGYFKDLIWDFKDLIYGIMFYRLISEDFANFMEGVNESIPYKTIFDDEITDEIKHNASLSKGYFIYPSRLFCNIINLINIEPYFHPILILRVIFREIEISSIGYPLENQFKGIISAITFKGGISFRTLEYNRKRIVELFNDIAELDFGQFEKDGSYDQLFEYLRSFLQAQNK